jgi:hypothetical protein
MTQRARRASARSRNPGEIADTRAIAVRQAKTAGAEVLRPSGRR